MSANERIERLLSRARAVRPWATPAGARGRVPNFTFSPRWAASLANAVGQTRSRGGAARVSDISRALFERIRRRPLASLAVALGVGIVVGGALSFRAGRIALAAAARHVAHEVLKQVL